MSKGKSNVDDISGVDRSPNLPIDEIENERQTLVNLVIDCSGSMSGYVQTMVGCLESFKQAIKNSKQEDEMLVAITRFGIRSGVEYEGYQLVNSMSTSYSADGMTPLYDAVCGVQERLYDGQDNGYMEELVQEGIKVKGIVVILSDGCENDSKYHDLQDSRRAIDLLCKQEIIVAFVAFGGEARDEADRLGVDPQNIMETDASESELRRIFDIVSKSAISASKNAAVGQSQSAFFV